MTRLTLLLLASGGIAAAVDLEAEDRRAGLAYLTETHDAVVEAARGLSEAQWNFRPAAGAWSIAQIVEHLALAEEFLLGQTTGEVMKAPAPAASRDYHSLDRLIRRVIPDRSNKAKAPAALTPTGRWTPADALRRFDEARARTKRFLESAAGLRDHAVDSPLGQPMDAYQSLLSIAAHCERHTRQIEEVKSDASFPGHRRVL